VLPILAAVAAMPVVFTVDGGTRYRAPVEPLLVVIACSSAVPALSSLRARRRLRRSGTGSADRSPTPSSGSRPRASAGVR
jgi:hypothetical protein